MSKLTLVSASFCLAFAAISAPTSAAYVESSARPTADVAMHPVTHWPCEECVVLVVTDDENYYGDLTIAAMPEFASWGEGTVDLVCSDGLTTGVIDLGTSPASLEGGLEMTSTDIPVVDYSSGNLTCDLKIRAGEQEALVPVTVS